LTYRFKQFHALALTLFLLSIWPFGCEFCDAVDSIRKLSLIFRDNFKAYRDSVFADDSWISSDIAFLTISCVNRDSIFAIDLMRRP
jgi:hypothetical protein